ncbi:MAG: tRNA (adenosine(37)-N6)-threonylcarbamoyltransferase complex transferase subunit TsaD [Terracidiphilus sp.]
MGTGLILGIETSCDETAAAVVERGRRTVSSVVASQIATHARYGGVVPELASREHLRAIVPVVRAALEQAGVGFKDLDAVAVTAGPGLAGALLVGITYAKALAFANRLPLIAVNHLEGHIHAVLLREREERDARQNGEPALALVVSGGHTHLYMARPRDGLWSYELIGRTVDDAAGEAYDKVAKLLGLGYPGGPWIDALAQFGDPNGVAFSFSQVKAKVHLRGKTARTKGAITSPIADLDPHFLFSFSGIKTAVLRYVEVHGLRIEAERRAELLYSARAESDGRGTDGVAKPAQTKDEALALCTEGTLNLIASFQHAVIGDLIKKTLGAAERLGAGRILVTGGVAANRELRERFSHEAEKRGLEISFPTKALSTDNAAMIAAAAWPRFEASEFAPADLSGDPALKLA